MSVSTVASGKWLQRTCKATSITLPSDAASTWTVSANVLSAS